MIKSVFFDFDGTLADTSEGIIRSSLAMQERMGLPLTSREQICSGIGLPLRESIKLGSGVPEERADEGVLIYREIYAQEAFGLTKPFPGVREALESLRSSGVVMAIATSRSSRSLHIMLESMGFTHFFSDILTADDHFAYKPAPDMVLALLERLHCSNDRTLVVGDTTYDIMMGSGARCRTCGVTWGNHDRATLSTASPDWIIDGMAELPAIIEQTI